MEFQVCYLTTFSSLIIIGRRGFMYFVARLTKPPPLNSGEGIQYNSVTGFVRLGKLTLTMIENARQ